MIVDPPRPSALWTPGPSLLRPIPESSPAEGRTVPIGRTALSRPIEVSVAGDPRSRLRLLVLAGQHGDEARGRVAARRWWTEPDRLEPVDGTGLERAVLVDANPDGSAGRTRTNAAGIDLNRDHRALRAPETQAIHRFIREFRPHLVVDVHNYPARRRILLDRGWTIDEYVRLAGPTHPAVRTALSSEETEDLFRSVTSDLRVRGYSSSPYLLYRRTGRLRPSTVGTRDARNAIALRYGVPTVLLEGRDPGRDGTADDFERTVAAQLEALRAIERWILTHRRPLLRGPPIPEVGEPVPVRGSWVDEGMGLTVSLRNLGTGRAEPVSWAAYAGTLRVRRSVPLPRAYAVRPDSRTRLEWLRRHDFEGEVVPYSRVARVEPVASGVAAHPTPSPSPSGTAPPFPVARDLEGYVVYSTLQRGGRALAVWCERQAFPSVRSEDAAPEDGVPGDVWRVLSWEDPLPRSVRGFLVGMSPGTDLGGAVAPSPSPRVGPSAFPGTLPVPEATDPTGRRDTVPQARLIRPRTAPPTGRGDLAVDAPRAK